MSQQDLSKELRVRPHVISNWERGKYAPTPTHRAALCVVLGCKLSDLEVLESAVQ
jgi:ribosome-binding protein aMBF1 (putative translation factor)